MTQPATIVGVSPGPFRQMDFDAHSMSFADAAIALEEEHGTFLYFAVVAAARPDGGVHCYWAGERKGLISG